MHSTLILLAVTLCLGLTNAAALPKGTPDGIYITYTHANGTEHTEALPLPPSHSSSLSSSDGSDSAALATREEISKRDGCNGFTLNHADVLSAVVLLKNYCGSGHTFGSSVKLRTVVGSAFAYVCVYPAAGGTCTIPDITTAVNRITSKCGSYISGWYTFGTNIAYGYEATGNNYCF